MKKIPVLKGKVKNRSELQNREKLSSPILRNETVVEAPVNKKQYY